MSETQCLSGPDKIRIQAVDHLEWAQAIGRSIGLKWGFRGQEIYDLEQWAVEVLLVKIPDYNPPSNTIDHHGLFRGWCHGFIAKRIHRECFRLQNAGTCRIQTDRSPRHVYPLSDWDMLIAGDKVTIVKTSTDLRVDLEATK